MACSRLLTPFDSGKLLVAMETLRLKQEGTNYGRVSDIISTALMIILLLSDWIWTMDICVYMFSLRYEEYMVAEDWLDSAHVYLIHCSEGLVSSSDTVHVTLCPKLILEEVVEFNRPVVNVVLWEGSNSFSLYLSGHCYYLCLTLIHYHFDYLSTWVQFYLFMFFIIDSLLFKT